NPQNIAIDWSDATSTGAVEISPPSLTTNGTLAIPLISDASVATVRLEFGLGDWETISTSGCDLNARDARVCFAPCGDNPNTAVISIYLEQGKDTELRVLALDENGYEHEPSDVAYGKKEITATFHDLPMERVQEFFVQSRPHGWVEFRNVSLVPGQETTVEVATGAPG
ncbi:MAG: hypothetical protein IH991_18370, partial [Planctomycetes bacterium]|nr:hypothetical protein [Planctomycetota bacterium]